MVCILTLNVYAATVLIVQDGRRDQLGLLAPKFAELNDDKCSFGEVWSRTDELAYVTAV